jgi:hypothetical protein
VRPFRQYRPLEFRQVCAIARAVFHREAPVDDASWKAAVKTVCAHQGWEEPPSDLLSRALSAVEHALARDGVVRAPTPPRQAAAASHALDTPPPTRQEAIHLLDQLGALGLMKHMPIVRPLTVRQAECQKAAQILAQGILEQVQRCEEAERAVERMEVKP